MKFFYISAPFLEKSKEATVREIREVILRRNIATGKQLSLERAKFKLTNLDTLMLSNDKILKLQSLLEGFLRKIDKQYLDLTEKPSHNWYVRGVEEELPVEKFLTDFRWNEAKYSRGNPIPKLIETFETKLNMIENELRNKVNAYNDLRTQLTQNTNKEGNYYVRDLTDLLIEPNIQPADFVYSRYLTTVVAVVPESSSEEFLKTYAYLSRNVVPYSAKKLGVPSKDDLSLWKVNIFTSKLNTEEEDSKSGKNLTPVQEFAERVRDKIRASVREFRFEAGNSEVRRKKREELEARLKSQVKTLCDVCQAYFSQIFELYIHAKSLRLVIETSLRFGNDQTVFYSINCIPGKEKIALDSLVQIFGDMGQEGLYGTKDEIEDTEDFFPFIYVPALTM